MCIMCHCSIGVGMELVAKKGMLDRTCQCLLVAENPRSARGGSRDKGAGTAFVVRMLLPPTTVDRSLSFNLSTFSAVHYNAWFQSASIHCPI